jgi:serine phosphatase RsbU (regulator of sigma subunit)
MSERPRILTIEDERTVRRSLVAYLEDSGYEMAEAENGQAGLDAIAANPPDLVLCDLRMPELDGIEVLRHVSQHYPNLPFVIVSGTGDIGDAIEALKLGAWDYVTKPIHDLAVLDHAMKKALERARLVRENESYREHLEATNKRLHESLRKLEADESAARRIQFQLLPPVQQKLLGHTFSHYLKTSTLLSGDFVDYCQYDSHRAGFYFADVSGHGVSSALITMLLHNNMRHLLEQYLQGKSDLILFPDRVLSHLNAAILQQGVGKYLTMFYGVINTLTGHLIYSNAGQFPWPVLADAEGVRFLEDRNLPVGLFDDAAYPVHEIPLAAEYRLALFSDGVLELFAADELPEQQARLLSQLESERPTIAGIIRGLKIDQVVAPPDDITLLLIRRGD